MLHQLKLFTDPENQQRDNDFNKPKPRISLGVHLKPINMKKQIRGEIKTLMICGHFNNLTLEKEFFF